MDSERIKQLRNTVYIYGPDRYAFKQNLRCNEVKYSFVEFTLDNQDNLLYTPKHKTPNAHS